MSLYAAYLEEIEKRKEQGLNPKPIDDAALTEEIIAQIKDTGHAHREQSLKFFIYNTLPGTTSASSPNATSNKTRTDGPPFMWDKSSNAKSTVISATCV